MTDHDADNCLDCNPGAAQLGETMSVDPREWTPLDDHGTEIYVYGDQPVDIAYQIGAEDEIRQLREALDQIGWLLDEYRGAKALREGVRAVVERVREDAR